MSRALALAALLLFAAVAAAPLANAQSIPFAKEVAGGAQAATGVGAAAAATLAGGVNPVVNPDPASAIKADPAPARR